MMLPSAKRKQIKVINQFQAKHTDLWLFSEFPVLINLSQASEKNELHCKDLPMCQTRTTTWN